MNIDGSGEKRMNHDMEHCADYTETCPKSCFRAQLNRDLWHIDYGLPVSWVHFMGTKECQKTKEEKR